MMPIGAAAEKEGHFAGDRVLAGQRGHVPLDRQFAGMQRQARDRPVQSRRLGHVDE